MKLGDLSISNHDNRTILYFADAVVINLKTDSIRQKVINLLQSGRSDTTKWVDLRESTVFRSSPITVTLKTYVSDSETMLRVYVEPHNPNLVRAGGDVTLTHEQIADLIDALAMNESEVNE